MTVSKAEGLTALGFGIYTVPMSHKDYLSTGYIRGHLAYLSEDLVWRYVDSDVPVDDESERACVRCGKLPTTEGYDNCLGELPGISNADCGHGEDSPYLMFSDEKVFRQVIAFLKQINGEDGANQKARR